MREINPVYDKGNERTEDSNAPCGDDVPEVPLPAGSRENENRTNRQRPLVVKQSRVGPGP